MIARLIFLAALAAIGYLGFVRRNRLPVNIGAKHDGHVTVARADPQ